MPDRSDWPDRSPAPSGAVDLTMMFAEHDAFRRDARRVHEACAALPFGAAPAPEDVRRWTMFRDNLRIHHITEDTVLWPALRHAVAGGADIATVDALGVQHGHLAELLAEADVSLTAGRAADAARPLGELRTVLGEHLAFEEASALPLVERDLGAAGYRVFDRDMRRAHPVRTIPAYLEWLLDGAPPAHVRAVLGVLPAPVRLVYGRRFGARGR